MRSLILIFTFLVVSVNSFAGIKCQRSATNPASSISSDGKINLVTTSNTIRTKHYYDTTGFHLLDGWRVEGVSTNYVLNSFFSIDSDSDGVADNFAIPTSFTKSLETISFNNIAGARSQKSSKTLTSEVGRYASCIDCITPNDSFVGSSGAFNVVLSFYARGDVSNITTGTAVNNWVSLFQISNTETYYTTVFTNRRINQAVSDGLHATDWHKFVFTGSVNNVNTQKLRLLFFYFPADTGQRPTTGESFWIEIAYVQIEKQTNMTSYIPTTTTIATRNAESYKCRKFAD